MSDDGKSYGQILRSTSIIGGASILNILIGLVRIKIAAVLLRPAGVGLLGLFNNMMATAANVAALGTGNVGTRQIAEAVGQDDPTAVAVARRALFWGTVALSIVGALVFWLLRGVLAKHVLDDPARSDEVGWLAIGVGLTVATGSQAALLNGLRQIGDLARVSVYSALIATALGAASLVVWRERGMLIYLLLTPVAAFVVAQRYVSRLPRLDAPVVALTRLAGQWMALARLGVAFMLAGLAMTGGQLAVRSLVQRQLGSEALGYFEASWLISMTYISFVLRAMGTDFYPRLTAAIRDHTLVNRMVNEQTEVALLLAGPVLLTMLGLAPWVVAIMYSGKFAPATDVLRWQVIGDLLKVASWPLGFILLAQGNARMFLFSDTLAMAFFVVFVWLGLPIWGLPAAGIGFLAMYAAYLPLVYWLGRKRTGFSWSKDNAKLFALLALACGFTSGLSVVNARIAAVASVGLALAFARYAVIRLKDALPIFATLDKRLRTFRRPRK